ncbi:chaperonin: PROVISIONAL [Gigaspora margarita]|uniref:Chaperonin: PROVISIONAL n=1 Tax=Gigaspora margarita TaxID=4874 RepID=A0A8H3X5X9_GIGMA|nr:chaperonin: PROVISIONAL [Gigaspora margarita]
MAHFLFNSVYTENHPELDSLNTSILALQNTYQSTYSGDIEEDKISLIEEEKEISILADEQLYNIESDIFSKTQIINFYKKYNQKIETKLIDNDSKNNKILTQQNIEALALSLILLIKWDSIRKHFLEHDILPISHGLKNQNSNNKISFNNILHILTFISNYANIHGLPSPATESTLSLFHLYMSSIIETSDYIISSTSFINIWKLYLPEIKFLSPRNDLCIKCKTMQFNISYISESKLEQTINEWKIHND